MHKSPEQLLEDVEDDSPAPDPIEKNQFRLKLYFAILSCLGGLVLASGERTELIPVVAIFFAFFGFVFVDWLKLFSLPSAFAYLLMGIAAAYCVSDFWNLQTPGNQQMLSVAQLLVFVQAILMLQKKTPRIFEQLGVFCLLELVVAAVFNDAIAYGALLIPIGLIGVWALALLASLPPGDNFETPTSELLPVKSSASRGVTPHSMIRHSSNHSRRAMAVSASRMRRYAMWTLAPAALFVGGVFFYALPRTTDAARMDGQGSALVGFDDQMRLEQIGQMLQSSEPALRVRLSDRRSGRAYKVVGGLYLRGQVLEEYQPNFENGKPTATWASSFRSSSFSPLGLPREFVPPRRSDINFFDSVDVEITCESMRSPALFAIAPYFRTKSNRDVAHSDGRWTLSRRDKNHFEYPRTRYQFGTNAFRGNIQTDKIATDMQRSSLRDEFSELLQAFRGEFPRPQRGSYEERLLGFDRRSMPTVTQVARKIKASLPADQQSSAAVARALENHLAVTGNYQYTLRLNATPVDGLDPIEQFLSIDRRGHCQYFSSALVMMLRSLGIPARVVVGYRTEEYNEIGQYYLARQSHAHAWVEALLPKSELEREGFVYGQPDSESFWVRLDPTPGSGGADVPDNRGVQQVLNLAKDIWEEYVVDMDARRQTDVLAGTDGDDTMSGVFGSFVGWVQRKFADIRAKGLRGGSLAVEDVFSWQAAVIGLFLAAAMLVLVRLRFRWFSPRRFARKTNHAADRPQVPFYAEALAQLARLGLRRETSQTPQEFVEIAAHRLSDSVSREISASLHSLTSEFCRRRYGRRGETEENVEVLLSTLTNQVDTALRQSGATPLMEPSN